MQCKKITFFYRENRDKKYSNYAQNDAAEAFRYIVDGLCEGELRILKEDEKLSKEKTSYKKRETFTQKIMSGYTVSHLACLHDDYNSWTFDAFYDLIIGIRTSKEEDESKKGEYVFKEEKKKRRKKKNKRTKKTKQELEDTHNILGELDLEELNAERFSREREDAERLFSEKLFQEGLEVGENGIMPLDSNKIQEEIPEFNAQEDTLYATGHIQRIPNAITVLKLTDLLDFHFSIQMLNNVDNYYTCPKCEKEVNLKENIRFVTLYYRVYCPPDFLCLSLKRFRQVNKGHGISFVKDDRHVQFDFELDLSKYCLSKILTISFQNLILTDNVF